MTCFSNISDPAASTLTDVPEDYLERVKKVHEVGGYGSTGLVVWNESLRMM